MIVVLYKRGRQGSNGRKQVTELVLKKIKNKKIKKLIKINLNILFLKVKIQCLMP